MRSTIRPGTSAESLADLGWFLVLTLGFVGAWRLSGSRVDCAAWVAALMSSVAAVLFGRVLRRRNLEQAAPR